MRVVLRKVRRRTCRTPRQRPPRDAPLVDPETVAAVRQATLAFVGAVASGGATASQCTDCHETTNGAGSNMLGDKTLHLSGKPDVAFSANALGMTYDANDKSCTGTCHNKRHDDDDEW